MKIKKMCGKIIATAFLVMMMVTASPKALISKVQAASYNADSALQYARDHWNDGNGLCASFVSRCVQAGGIGIGEEAGTGGCANAICRATGLSMVDLRLDSRGYATSALDGNILSAGDVVLQYCYTHSIGPHILICGGYDSEGVATFYAHNSAMNNRRYNLAYNTAYQHTTSCNMGAKVIHLNSINDNIVKGEQTISNGRYHIVSNLKESMGLDVAGASKSNCANINLYSNLNDNTQTFDITYLGNGYYKMINSYSGKAVDVAAASSASGTNVWSYDYNGSNAQKWIIKETGDKYTYNIISACGYKYLDVAGASTDDGTNVQIYDGNGTNAQKWKFIAVGNNTGKTIKDGEYHIVSALDNNKGVDVSGAGKNNFTNIQLYSNVNDSTQTFNVSYLGDGYYKIIGKYSGKSIDVDGCRTYRGTNVQLCEWNNTNAQKWIIKKSGNYYNIITKSSGMYLDVNAANSANGTNIQVYTGNGSNAQNWKFIPVKQAEPPKHEVVKEETKISEEKKEDQKTVEEKNDEQKSSEETVEEDRKTVEEKNDEQKPSEETVEEDRKTVEEKNDEQKPSEETVEEDRKTVEEKNDEQKPSKETVEEDRKTVEEKNDEQKLSEETVEEDRKPLNENADDETSSVPKGEANNIKTGDSMRTEVLENPVWYDEDDEYDDFDEDDEMDVPVIKKIRNVKKHTIKINLEADEEIDGYEYNFVRVTNKTLKKFKKKVMQSDGEKVSFSGMKTYTSKSRNIKLSKLKKGKKYAVTVRAYRIVNGTKVYSDYSNVKSVKIKK